MHPIGDLDGTGRDVIALASLASNVYMAKFLEGVRGLLHTCSIRLDHVDFAGLRRVAHKVGLMCVWRCCEHGLCVWNEWGLDFVRDGRGVGWVMGV